MVSAIYVGTPGSNTISGTYDVLYGDAGDDHLTSDRSNASIEVVFFGDAGKDFLDLNDLSLSTALMFGGGGNDILDGANYNDRLFGNAGNDKLVGRDGDDQLSGGFGNDILDGGDGADHLIFDTKLDAARNVDHIVNFDTSDTFYLAHSIFTKLAIGTPISAEAFALGSHATEPDDRIIYQKSTGKLFYDADGSKHVHDQILFAVVNNKADLTFNDFWCV